MLFECNYRKYFIKVVVSQEFIKSVNITPSEYLTKYILLLMTFKLKSIYRSDTNNIQDIVIIKYIQLRTNRIE